MFKYIIVLGSLLNFHVSMGYHQTPQNLYGNNLMSSVTVILEKYCEGASLRNKIQKNNILYQNKYKQACNIADGEYYLVYAAYNKFTEPSITYVKRDIK